MVCSVELTSVYKRCLFEFFFGFMSTANYVEETLLLTADCLVLQSKWTQTRVCRLNLFIYEVVVFFQGTSLFLFFNRLWTLAKSIIRFCKRKPGISPILNQRSFQRVCCLKTREKETLYTINPAARIRNEMVCPSPRLACHNQSLFQRLRGE